MGWGLTLHGTPAHGYPHEAHDGGAASHQEGLHGVWMGDRWLVLPPRPSTAAWLSSALGNVLGFLGSMPEYGEARGDPAMLPGEALLPAAFHRQCWEGNPYSKELHPAWGPGLLPPLLYLLADGAGMVLVAGQTG